MLHNRITNKYKVLVYSEWCITICTDWGLTSGIHYTCTQSLNRCVVLLVVLIVHTM